MVYYAIIAEDEDGFKRKSEYVKFKLFARLSKRTAYSNLLLYVQLLHDVRYAYCTGGPSIPSNKSCPIIHKLLLICFKLVPNK